MSRFGRTHRRVMALEVEAELGGVMTVISIIRPALRFLFPWGRKN